MGLSLTGLFFRSKSGTSDIDWKEKIGHLNEEKHCLQNIKLFIVFLLSLVIGSGKDRCLKLLLIFL